MMGEVRTSPGSGRRSVEEIEREFTRLRMDEGGTVELRSSVLNLIVVTDEDSAGDATRAVSRLSGNLPSRAIILISDPDEPRENLDIRLSVFCEVRGGATGQVCAEQVTIHAEGPPAHHLGSLAGPLLLPDVPTFLWYPGSFAATSPELVSVDSLFDRLIVDSGAAPDRPGCLRELAGMLERPEVPALGDLQWVALSPWRSLVAELFGPPERARTLPDVDRVEILHDSRGEARALLMAGWLASSLGWRPRERNGGEVSFSTPSGREAVIALDPSSPDASLRRVRLYAGEWSFQVSRHRELSEAKSTVMKSGEIIGERTVQLGNLDRGILLGEELQYRGRDDVHESALRMAVELIDL